MKGYTMARRNRSTVERFEDGSTSFFTTRRLAYTQVGTEVQGALTAEDALKKAHLDWEVFKSDEPVSTMVPMAGESAMEEGSMEEITYPDKFMTYRYSPHTGKPEALGVVGNRYTPVQNMEAFSILNHIVDESGAVFENAGSLDLGRKVFMSLKLPNTMQIGGIDPIDLYLLAFNTHDGSSSFTLAVTPIRLACYNQLNMALRTAKQSFTLRHTLKVSGKIQEAREKLQLTFKYAEEFEREAELLLSQDMTDKQFNELVETVFPIDKDGTPRASTMAENARSIVTGLWNAPTQSNIANTKWAAYNAFAEYADWAKPVRDKNPDIARAIRVVNGSGDNFKNKVLNLL